jgi:hypothetical protein
LQPRRQRPRAQQQSQGGQQPGVAARPEVHAE